MPRYRVRYSFVDQFTGDADAIKRAIRDLSFSQAFSPLDLNDWKISQNCDAQTFTLSARRTFVDEIYESSERAALRKFLYGIELPDEIDVGSIKVERVEGGGDLAPIRDDAA